MADVRQYIRINPVDTQTDVAVGVPLPFDAEGVFNLTYTTQEQMKSNILNILLTEPGERVFKPDFGVGLRNYLFENFTDTEDLRERITSQVEVYAPDIEILNVDLNKDPNSHTLSVNIYYRVLVNNEVDAIQVNFAPDEGLNDMSPSITSY
jgi:phage baseplate assembly protein W